MEVTIMEKPLEINLDIHKMGCNVTSHLRYSYLLFGEKIQEDILESTRSFLKSHFILVYQWVGKRKKNKNMV